MFSCNFDHMLKLVLFHSFRGDTSEYLINRWSQVYVRDQHWWWHLLPICCIISLWSLILKCALLILIEMSTIYPACSSGIPSHLIREWRWLYPGRSYNNNHNRWWVACDMPLWSTQIGYLLITNKHARMLMRHVCFDWKAVHASSMPSRELAVASKPGCNWKATEVHGARSRH